MARPRTSGWYDPSQVFADTRRVDLFNDPPWEMPRPHAAGQSTMVDERGSRWASLRSSVVGVFVKRGQHSHKLA